MPVVHVNMWKGVSDEAANQIITGITQVMVDLGIPAQAVEVLIHEIPKKHWGIGGVPASEGHADTVVP
ncbi:MAG TPA: tautomerase family protein [Candidatus Lokiarchaeia archaeon]|nr:tautomerase family protein [Candidatus Lokiarchaeia archaeon]